ncbi:DUF523 domain-containing protein [Oscillibacter sp.]|uniref:DUF523 domain-containing protein n=1 Tax=Oscillibacter sp. TaxID=1945593 RepID=UPI002D7FD49A|nr:DUF523 domain-containing protein [Oscillibacter sp.]
MKVLVSACLLGENCKYSGGNNLCPGLLSWLKREGHEAVPVCPEQLGGLPTPRTPAEIVDGTVTDRDGRNVDGEFRRGAVLALEAARREGAELAVLQPRSPSCGVRQVYDGTFSGRRVGGQGVFAKLLAENGFRLLEPEDLP